MPICAACKAAAVRDATPIFASTVETWWCTVRSEMNSRREISNGMLDARMIAPDKIAQIFEPYFTTKPSGSGLGLLIVRRIVREHGGDLQLESHEGRGTTVRVVLPLPERRVKLLPPANPETTATS